jgi:chromosome segregation ATPase
LLAGSKNTAATLAQLRTQVTERDTTITSLRADLAARDATIAAQLAELAMFREQTAQLQSTITALETSAVSVEEEVNHRIAAANVPAAELPQAAAAPVATESAEDLWKAAEAESDPKKKGDLAARAMALTQTKKPHGQN